LRTNPFEEEGDESIPPSMAMHFREEIESSLQGGAKLFSLGHNGVL